MSQSPSHAMRCISVVLLTIVSLSMPSCKGIDDESSKQDTYNNPAELVAALRKHPARTLQDLHTQPPSIEKDALILNTVEEFPRRSKPLCSILSTRTAIDRCLRLTERPHLWKRQPHHFAKSTHPAALERDCTIDPHPNTCWTAQALLDAKKDWTLAEDACRQIESDLWQAECFFTLAESIEVTKETLPKALQICSYSDQFQKSCWMHAIVHLAQQESTPINEKSWLNDTYSILQSSPVLPEEMKVDLWQHLLAKIVSTHIQIGVVQNETTPTDFAGHWQNEYAIEVLRWCDIPIQDITEWSRIAKNIHTTPCKRLSEPRGMDLESDLWVDQSLPSDCNTISFVGQSHRIYCLEEDDTQLAHGINGSFLSDSVRTTPIFVQESLNSENPVIRKRATNLQDINWQEKPDER